MKNTDIKTNIEEDYKNLLNTLLSALDNDNPENIRDFFNNSYQLLTTITDSNFALNSVLCNQIAARLSSTYKNSQYKVGDKVHVKEDSICEEDCTIVDVLYLWNTEFKPVIVYIVEIPKKGQRSLRSIDSIQYKINE